MVKKIIVCLMISISFVTTSQASEELDNYYPLFETCLEKLEAKFEIDGVTYGVTMNYRALIGYMEDLNAKAVAYIAAIAIEWSWDTEFPEFSALSTKEGRLQVAKAIQTAQAKAILRAAESILCKDKVWL